MATSLSHAGFVGPPRETGRHSLLEVPACLCPVLSPLGPPRPALFVRPRRCPQEQACPSHTNTCRRFLQEVSDVQTSTSNALRKVADA